jgi:hypothetical protein
MIHIPLTIGRGDRLWLPDSQIPEFGRAKRDGTCPVSKKDKLIVNVGK